MKPKKQPNLREQMKAAPGVTLTDTDVTFAGAPNLSVMPGSGKLVTPDPEVAGKSTKIS